MLNASSKAAKDIKTPNKSSRETSFLTHPLFIVFSTIAVFFITQVLAYIFAAIIESIIHPGAKTDTLIENSAPAQFIYILLAEGSAIWCIVLILRSRGASLRSIGLGRRPIAKDIIKGILGFAAFFVILAAVNIVLSAIFPDLDKEQQDVGFNTLNSSMDYLLALFSLVILPPIGEEVLVRGYLFSGLRARLSFARAALITSLIFGLAHLQLGNGAAVVWAAGIDTFVLSLVLVYLRERTGALYAGMIVHALNNLIAFSVHFHH
jgi:membrane protease YdiL (CAAX protease family)